MKMKKWSSQWTQFMQLREEAWTHVIMLCSIYTICFIIPEKPERGEDN